MSKLIIAVDIDEVIFPMVDDLIEYLDKTHKVKMTAADFEKYDIREIWEGGEAEAHEIFEDYKRQDSVEVAPLEGAREALHKLSKSYELIIMTARDVAVEEKTVGWLSRHFPELFKDVHLVGNRRESQTFKSKAEVCRELGVFCLIDDSLKNVLQAHEAGVKCILFGDYPWNQADSLPIGLERAKSWDEVLEML